MSEKAASVSVVNCVQFVNVCLFYCSLYLVCVLIVVIMGRWFEFSVCIVCQVVEIVVMSGEVVFCSVAVYSMMCSELLIMSEIS